MRVVWVVAVLGLSGVAWAQDSGDSGAVDTGTGTEDSGSTDTGETGSTDTGDSGSTDTGAAPRDTDFPSGGTTAADLAGERAGCDCQGDAGHGGLVLIALGAAGAWTRRRRRG